MAKIWFLLGLLFLLLAHLLGIHIDFERTEQLTGFDVYGSTLRVRKYNRTTIVLNGTFTSKIVLDNKYVVSNEAESLI